MTKVDWKKMNGRDAWQTDKFIISVDNDLYVGERNYCVSIYKMIGTKLAKWASLFKRFHNFDSKSQALKFAEDCMNSPLKPNSKEEN